METKAALKLWKLASPARDNPYFTAIALEKLGTPGDLTAGLRRAVELLGFTSDGKGDILPASFGENGDCMVRKALCPDIASSIKLYRATAWCCRMGKRCHHLVSMNGPDGYVVCNASNGSSREAAKWFEMGGGQGKLPPADFAALSKILALLGPAAAMGYKRWRSKALKEELTGPQRDSYSLVSSILKAEALGYTWNATLRRFNLARADSWIEIHEDGQLVIKYRSKHRLIPIKKRIDALFDLTKKIKMGSQPRN